MTAFVAASDTARRTASIPSAAMPQPRAYAAISRRMAPTPGGVDGNVASKDVDTMDAYPGPGRHYLWGLRRSRLAQHGCRVQAARGDERGHLPPGQRRHGGGAGPRGAPHVLLRVRPV